MSTPRLMQELRSARGSSASTATVLEKTQPCISRAAIKKHPPLAVPNDAQLTKLKQDTPAKIGVGRAGLRYRTQTLLQFLADFAVAKNAVESQIPNDWPQKHGYVPLGTAATDAQQFLARPDLGRILSEESLRLVQSNAAPRPDVQIVVGDGLSAVAVMQNAPAMVESLVENLRRRGLSVGTIFFVRHCRAKIVDVIGEQVGAQVGIILLGERPGLGTGDGMSAYLVYRPGADRTDAQKQAISNIHHRGILPREAGQYAAQVIEEILRQQTSGVTLDLHGLTLPQSERPRQNQAHPNPRCGCGQSHGQQCSGHRQGHEGPVCRCASQRPCEARAQS